MIHQKKNTDHRTSKIFKSNRSYRNDHHLSYHCSLHIDASRGVWISLRSEDTQKQLGRTSLIGDTNWIYFYNHKIWITILIDLKMLCIQFTNKKLEKHSTGFLVDESLSSIPKTHSISYELVQK